MQIEEQSWSDPAGLEGVSTREAAVMAESNIRPASDLHFQVEGTDLQ